MKLFYILSIVNKNKNMHLLLRDHFLYESKSSITLFRSLYKGEH